MIKSFEGVRGFAALMVAIYHLLRATNTPTFSLIDNAYLFVDLFFVLSGFVICAAYSDRLHEVKDIFPFMIRRFGRLYPLMLATTITYVLAQNIFPIIKKLFLVLGLGNLLQNPGVFKFLGLPSTEHIIGTLTLTQGLGIFDKLSLNFVSWSISTEFYTYLLFGLLAVALVGSYRLIAFAIIGVVALAVTYWGTINVHDCLNVGRCLDVTYDFGFPRCIGSFLLGALTYYLARKWTFNANTLQLISFTVLVGIFTLVNSNPWIGLLAPFAFALLIVALSSDRGYLAELLKTKPFQMLGVRSYSIYMIHTTIIVLLGPLLERQLGFLFTYMMLATYVAIVIFVSGYTYRFIEDPFRKRFNRIADKVVAEGDIRGSQALAK